MTVTHWEGEDVIITFEEKGSNTCTNYEGKILSIRQTGGTEETESVQCFGNKTITIQKPREDFEIEFEVVVSDTSFAQMWFGGSGNEIRSSSSGSRWRIIVWFCPSSSHKKSGNVVVPPKSGEMMRYIYKDCYAVSFEEEFSAEDYLKGTLRFRVSATDANGYANIFKEYTNDYSTTPLTTLNTTAHGGTLSWNTTTPAWTSGY